MRRRTSLWFRPLGSRRLAAGTVAGCLLVAFLAVAVVAPAAAPAKTKLPCYEGFSFESLRLRVKPHHCRQFVDNQPDHAGEVTLKGIHWHTWNNRQATGTGWWIYFVTGGGEKRTKVTLHAYNPLRYCARYYSRLRVDWKTRHHHHRHLILSPPYPPGGCE
jgi:hypothetical protein